MAPLTDGPALLADGVGDGGSAPASLDFLGDIPVHAISLPEVTRRHKSQVTRGNVPFGNVRRMDAGWTEAKEPWERVRWARSQKFRFAKDAAASLGMVEGTYRAYEREPGSSKATALDDQRAVQFGKKFGVSWTWLLLGEGTPYSGPPTLTPAQERVVTIMADVSEEDQERVAAAVELLLKTGS